MSTPSLAPVAASGSSITQLLDEQLRRQPTQEQFVRGVLELSCQSLDSAWELLALIDQYYRRRRISEAYFRAARSAIQRRALGIQEAPAAPLAAARQTAEPMTTAAPTLQAPQAAVRPVAAPPTPIKALAGVRSAAVPVAAVPPAARASLQVRWPTSRWPLVRLAVLLTALAAFVLVARTGHRPETAPAATVLAPPADPAPTATATPTVNATTTDAAATASPVEPPPVIDASQAQSPATPVAPTAAKPKHVPRIISCIELLQKREDGELTPRESELLNEGCLE